MHRGLLLLLLAAGCAAQTSSPPQQLLTAEERHKRRPNLWGRIHPPRGKNNGTLWDHGTADMYLQRRAPLTTYDALARCNDGSGAVAPPKRRAVHSALRAQGHRSLICRHGSQFNVIARTYASTGAAAPADRGTV